MSYGNAAVLIPAGLRGPTSRADVVSTERRAVRSAAFGALGLYGVMRWGALLSPAPAWRLLGLLGLAVLVAILGEAICVRHRRLAVLTAAIAAVLALPIAGVPVSYVWHVRIAVAGDAIGQGLSALPQVLVPYNGINEWVRVVIVLGAGVLLLDAAAMLAFVPRSLGELRLAGAALPLVALAVVPSILARPQLAYLHGLVLFALLAAFMWGERVPRRDAAAAVAVASLAGAGAMIAGPALDRHRAWLDYHKLASTLSPAHIEKFDWSQRYGPLRWPRTGHEVLDVVARRPDYWKAEDLDVFDGRGWVSGATQLTDPLSGVAPSELSRWTQSLKVTIRGMQSTDVVAAGAASAPTHVSGVVLPGAGPGTWTTVAQLGPGDSYRVSTYAPHPTSSELATVPANGYAAPPEYRTITVPQVSIPLGNGTSATTSPPVVFAPFGSSGVVDTIPGLTKQETIAGIAASPYGRAFTLARQLALGSTTSYGYAMKVQRYLARGFSYNENPRPRRYPLESFLFKDRVGYCQQFSGAMALLLRMGGVPARVAAGFTTGRYDSSAHKWVVSDTDAHAWVEAWFPRYGWVPFDPTPAAAPARGGHVPIPALRGQPGGVGRQRAARRPEGGSASRGNAVPSSHRGTGGGIGLIITAIVALAALLLVVLRAPRGQGEPTDDELIAELERALERCGRPLAGGVTLAALEHRFRADPDAAAYVRAIRWMRFGGGGSRPTPAQRRALRAQLRTGLGAFGRLRAMWALPPMHGRRSSRGRSPRSLTALRRKFG